ncbi:hypothetical protein NECID01_0404 [Nematocida sp. AWRm77]|nr:hypothetical protein NECID01_0404 [Nematocida sp. AWRm77]
MNRKYTIGEQIGKGATCTVYEGQNRSTGECVAIKAISSGTQRNLHLAINEIRVLERLAHPNIVGLLETIETDTQTLLVLEKCKFSLSSVVKSGALAHKVVVRIFRDLLVGLRYMHANGIIHRDIKLGNVMISENNELKIIDFGLSKDTMHSTPKTFCGTPDFISPEILDRKPYTKKTDMYSAGMLVYFLVFRSEYSREKIVNAKNSSQYRDLVCLLEKLLETNPDKRLSAEEALSDRLFHAFLPQGLSVEGVKEFQMQTKLGRIEYARGVIKLAQAQSSFIIRAHMNGIYQENIKTHQDMYTPFSAVDSKTLKLVGFCYSVLGLVRKRTPVVIIITDKGKFFKMMKEGVYVYITEDRYALWQKGGVSTKSLKTKESIQTTEEEKQEMQRLIYESISTLGSHEDVPKPITVDRRLCKTGHLKQSLYQSVGIPTVEAVTLANLAHKPACASLEPVPVFTSSGCILRVEPYVFAMHLLCGECLILNAKHRTLSRFLPNKEKEMYTISDTTDHFILQKILLFESVLGHTQNCSSRY